MPTGTHLTLEMRSIPLHNLSTLDRSPEFTFEMMIFQSNTDKFSLGR